MSAHTDTKLNHPDVSIKTGIAHLYFAFDIGFAVNLDKAEGQITPPKARPAKKGASKFIQLTLSPLQVSRPCTEFEVGPGFRTQDSFHALIFDFGAISIHLTVPFSGDQPEVIQFIQTAYASHSLKEHARDALDVILKEIGPAVSKLSVAEHVEDYFVFQVTEFEPELSVETLIENHPEMVASLLRGETAPLSDEEVRDIVANRVSYGLTDVTFVGYDSALIYNQQAEDICTVLEYTNVALLEFSFLNNKLTQTLEECYDYLTVEPDRRPASAFKIQHPAMQKIGQLQLDTEIIFEGVTNSLKLFGDVFLARLFNLSSRQLGLEDWQDSIVRKLQTIESIYNRLSSNEANRRIETLEWIIIILIAVSILITFIPGFTH